MKKTPSQRQAYPHFFPMATRWQDNDGYGHVNNVVYYSYFDTAVNRYLMNQGYLNAETSKIIGLVVETQCTYFSSVSFPDNLDIAVRVDHMGNSSVRYGVAVFKENAELASAEGYFIHVYVDRLTHKPQPLPEALKNILRPLQKKV